MRVQLHPRVSQPSATQPPPILMRVWALVQVTYPRWLADVMEEKHGKQQYALVDTGCPYTKILLDPCYIQRIPPTPRDSSYIRPLEEGKTTPFGVFRVAFTLVGSAITYPAAMIQVVSTRIQSPATVCLPSGKKVKLDMLLGLDFLTGAPHLNDLKHAWRWLLNAWENGAELVAWEQREELAHTE